MVMHDFATTKGNAAMRAAIDGAGNLTAAIAPENQFFAHAGDAHGFVSNLVGFEHNIPLVADHAFISNLKGDRLSSLSYRDCSVASTSAFFGMSLMLWP